MVTISSLQLYEESATLEHVKSLAFNRTSTSTGETEAVNYIEKNLIESNLKSQIEHFEWQGPIGILMRTCYIIIFITLLFFRLFLLIIVYFVIKNSIAKLRKMSFIGKDESKNIYTQINAKNKTSKPPIVIISAHYDSISANLPYKFQVIIFVIYRLIIVFYLLAMVTFTTLFILDTIKIISISNFVTLLIIFTSIGAVFLSIPLLYIVFIEKPSSGSIDNASGVAISIELAKLLNKNPLENMDVLILFTGAEEWGFKGSKNFSTRHFITLKQKNDLDKSFNINIDMVGSYIGLFDKSGLFIKRKLNYNLNDILETTAKQLNIPIVRFNKIIKPKSDYKIF
ncbi:MAG: M28 family peptidase, partial [Promethearchaeota archaeon]